MASLTLKLVVLSNSKLKLQAGQQEISSKTAVKDLDVERKSDEPF